MIQVILYYQFAPIADTVEFRSRHERLCRELGLLGRIYVASEGINGTCSGTDDAILRYQEQLRREPGMSQIVFKSERVSEVPFHKLIVRVRPWLVNLGEHSDVDPVQEGGGRLTPGEWRAMLEANPDAVLLDVRNRYEYEMGRFRNAIPATVDQFFRFDEWVDALELPRDRPVLTYCTGGIRCEKFTGLLRRRGFDNVWQLDGGILGYAAEEGGAHFEGDVFVFDERLRTQIGATPNTWSVCHHCGEPTSRPQNCANMDCNQLFVCCESCAVAKNAVCSSACAAAPRLRKVDPIHPQSAFLSKGRVELVEANRGLNRS
jgi:UPF0176 protein